MKCYRVTLETTNYARDKAKAIGECIDVIDGVIYVMARSMSDAAYHFPDGLCIQEVGLGFVMVDGKIVR